MLLRRFGFSALLLAALVCGPTAHGAAVGPSLDRPAVISALAPRSVLQGAAVAGNHLVAVGERGIVLLSTDAGKQWRQVPVPVSVGLTAVSFVDANNGWIVGHGGVVLATTDGGSTWTKQLDGRQVAAAMLKDAQASADARAIADAQRLVADGADKPFLAVHFFDAQHGLVIGAYNLAFATEDGGKSWQPVSRRLDNPRGLHLYAVRARGDLVVIAGEQGLVLRSTDRGRTYQRLAVPYKGSYFALELLSNDDIVLAGLRGNAWKSSDGGETWSAVKVPVPVSLTTSAVDAKGRLWMGNQAGMIMAYDGESLIPTPTKLAPLTGLLPLPDGKALALSVAGAAQVNLESPK